MQRISIATTTVWGVSRNSRFAYRKSKLRLIYAVPLILQTCWASAVLSEVRVVDGDTLDLGDVRVRIDGIDAPEFGQSCGSWACGKAALEHLSTLVSAGEVTCASHSEDGYGRTIATCHADGIDIGAEMVRAGYAWAFVKYSEEYISQEAQARDAALGIWRYNSVPAWEYRAAKWKAAEQTAPKGCPIKGNISKGGKIYHAPWSPWYQKTQVNEAKGEHWFCSEAEAVAAGWRAPRWK